MPVAVLIQEREGFGIYQSDQIQDCSFNMVHVRRGMKIKSVLPRSSLFEFLKRLQHICTVVGFRIILADLDPFALDLQRISDAGKVCSLASLCLQQAT